MKPSRTLTILLASCILIVSLAAQVRSTSIATTDYYLDTPLPIADYYIGEYSNNSYFSVNGSNWDNWLVSTNASYVIQQTIDAMSTGGTLIFGAGTYNLPTAISIVGNGAPSLSDDYDLTTFKIIGAGRWATIFIKTGSAGNMFEFSNAASVTFQDCYLNQDGINGYPIRGLATGADSVRCLMRSYFHHVEIHGVASSYYAMYLQNAYFINSFSLIYIRSGGGGILCESTATGYGNLHFENIYISLYGANTVGLYLRSAGANYGECSFDRIHVDGGSVSTTVGILLDGSNYNKFNYLKLEHVGTGVKILDGVMNEFAGGYSYCRVVHFNFSGTSQWGNWVHHISVHAQVSGCLLLDDDCNHSDQPNIFQDLIGYTTNFAATPVTRSSAICTYLKGTILDHKGNAGGSATISSGNSWVTVTHDLILTPTWVVVTGAHAETVDCYVTNIGTSTFSINVTAAVTGSRTVYWYASTSP